MQTMQMKAVVMVAVLLMGCAAGEQEKRFLGHLRHAISHGLKHLGHEIKKGVDHIGHEIHKGVDHVGHEIHKGVKHVGHEIHKGIDHLKDMLQHKVLCNLEKRIQQAGEGACYGYCLTLSSGTAWITAVGCPALCATAAHEARKLTHCH